ncbi:hypothetical protein [Clostridium botulinum]|uniref:hypothetical protein n=1 Tax=Clostridium botulinum TaxID=1491 RepID=UPI0004D8EED8|nr:hypothetical protein [Clostridium botulinum]KEI01580.1 hypothetical protein Z952_12070 [Clostridium botulinum C/D str. BKT75002]KEI07914.1 hypothetical protein Z954_03205 [Clostridium botulinum C/D str. BKT2873]QPW61559.1 hypothetical protein IG390_05180 [Clostridium botulinum]
MKGYELREKIKKDSERTRCIAILSKVLNCDYKKAEKGLVKLEKQYINQKVYQEKLELKEKIRKLIIDKSE